MAENLLADYRSLVREIHLAASSGDDMARLAIPDMYARKLAIEHDLGLSTAEQTELFETATADSSYRRQH